MYIKRIQGSTFALARLTILAIGSTALHSVPATAKEAVVGIPGWTVDQARAAESAVQPYANRSYVIPGVAGPAAERFRSAASLFTAPRTYPSVSVMAYDYVTRCALSGTVAADGSGTSQMRWVRYPKMVQTIAVPGMAGDSLRSLRGFALAREPADAPDCAQAVSKMYEGEPTQIRGAKKLTEHAVSLLAGAQIGSAEAPVSTAAFKRTVQGRVAAMGHLEGGDLLAAYSDANITIVILGAPGEQTRFASQYRNLPDGRWRFEGASALGYGLANYMESVR